MRSVGFFLAGRVSPHADSPPVPGSGSPLSAIASASRSGSGVSTFCDGKVYKNPFQNVDTQGIFEEQEKNKSTG